jgi:formiminoglutamase
VGEKSKIMSQLRIATKSDLAALTSIRPDETKLGERMQTADGSDWETALKNSSATFVLLGIPEDIGVRANYGIGGAHTLYGPALKALVNVQHTNVLKGESLLLLGNFDFGDLMRQSEQMDIPHLRELVEQIDAIVSPVIEKIILAGKVPIVAGGGHNNAFPLLQGVSRAYSLPVNCINLDAHSDYRAMEGRHSGNGFHYAKQKGYLDKYAIVGLHENYNAQNIVGQLTHNTDLHCSFYEDIFIREKESFTQSIKNALMHTAGKARGIELDLDCIEHTLSSAATPSGITSLQARQYVHLCASAGNAAYFHIAEGAVRLENGSNDPSTAKLAAYLITDFIKFYAN